MIEKRTVISLGAAAALHLGLLFFAVFTIKTAGPKQEESSAVIRLVDVREKPPEKPPAESPVVQDSPSAETVIETDEKPPVEKTTQGAAAGEYIEYLPMHLVPRLPKFSEEEINSRMIYPPIAQKAGIEGLVIIELFVDRDGWVRNISVLKEDPPDRGFGEAAVKSYRGLRGEPALSATGEQVAARFRRRVVFRLR